MNSVINTIRPMGHSIITTIRSKLLNLFSVLTTEAKTSRMNVSTTPIIK